MEQVFRFANTLLRSDAECEKRQLHFRTYKIIPLTSSTGVLEYVSGTETVSDVILACHERYNMPQDWPISSARKCLRDADRLSRETRLAAFEQTLLHVRPSLRYFFFEHRVNASAWWQMRLNFTRTVATASIIGHILGIGDRHVSNLLLDTATGDIIHIDFGIAFDAVRAKQCC